MLDVTSLIPRPSSLIEHVGKQSWRVRQDAPGGLARVLEVVRIDRTSWRISSTPIEEGELPRLLGFVERLDRDRFEVLWLADHITWAYVTTFDEALAAVADPEGFGGSIETHRDPSIEPPPEPWFHRIRRRTGGR